MDKALYLIVGRTCSGKDTLTTLLTESDDMKQVVSRTTRRRRRGEGDTHIFITEEQAKEIPLSERIANVEINGNEYFVTREDIQDKNVYVIDPTSIGALASNVPDRQIKVVYLMCTDYTRKNRYIKRSGAGKNVVDRALAEQDFLERNLAESEMFDDFEKSIKSADISRLNLPKNVVSLDVFLSDVGVESLYRSVKKKLGLQLK